MLGSPFAAMGLANLAQQFGSGGELEKLLFRIIIPKKMSANYSQEESLMNLVLFSGSTSRSGTGWDWRLPRPLGKPRSDSGKIILNTFR